MKDSIIRYEKDDIDDIMAYNDIMNFIHMDRIDDEDYIWKFKTVLGHQGPLTPRHKHWKESKYNVEIEWENGEITFKPLSKMKQDCPIIMAEYARKHSLLNTDGLKSLKRIAKRSKKLNRLIKQAKLKSYRTTPKYMYGFQVPRN